MNSILIVVIAFFILFILQNIINNRMGINDILSKNILTNLTKNKEKIQTKKNEVRKTIKEKSKVKVDYKDPFYKFPDPMLSNISHPLSSGYKPMYDQLNEGPEDVSSLDIVRKSNLDIYVRNPQVFNPAYIKKDTMDAHPGNHTLQGLAKKYDGKEKTIEMTSDEYLTKYPAFADSNIQNELTNVGYFFDNDNNNKYIDHQQKILPSNCSVNGDKMSCELNGAQHVIPDKLMKNDSAVLNSIGVMVDDRDLIKSTDGYDIGLVGGNNYKIWNYPEESGLNGGREFGDVYASGPMGSNETYMNVTNNLNCKSCAI